MSLHGFANKFTHLRRSLPLQLDPRGASQIRVGPAAAQRPSVSSLGKRCGSTDGPVRRGAYLPRSSRCQGSNQGRRHSHAGNRLGPPAEAGATGRDLHGEGELVLGRRRVVLAVPDLDNGSHAERKKNDAKKIETTENVLAVVRDGAGRRSDRNKPSMVCSAARCVDGARPTAGQAARMLCFGVMDQYTRLALCPAGEPRWSRRVVGTCPSACRRLTRPGQPGGGETRGSRAGEEDPHRGERNIVRQLL